MHIAAPARSEAPPHGICCHLHQMEITVLIRIKHLSRKRPFLVKVPFIRFPFTFSPNPGRWLLCVAEFSGIPSCYLYEIVKVQSQTSSAFWIKSNRTYQPKKHINTLPSAMNGSVKIMCFTRMTSLEFQLIRSILTDNLQQHLLMHPFRLLIHFTQIFQLHRSK